MLIIIITIVELMLPESKNKKYVMFVSGIMIMLSVVKPFIKLLTSDYDIESEVINIQKEINSIEQNSHIRYDVNNTIQNSYIKNLENDMKERLEDIGYTILETKINVDDSTYKPTDIEMKIKYNDGDIQPIIIDVFGNKTSENIQELDINKIKEIVSQNYGVAKENIRINNYE